ncbi:MAG: carboxylating nicotinate-nucleotide diphosphorylase [Myxococcota bacterium]|nr:carboxylating nicotinate-nucleotide diphosphorylase [Myxococcota bacterium]
MPAPPALPHPSTTEALLRLALEEDLGPGDVTSQHVLDAAAKGRAVIEAREELVVAALPIAARVFALVDPELGVSLEIEEGKQAAAGAALLRIEGSVRSILGAERTALNLLSRTCGVATWTRRFVDRVAGTGAAIVDTRKTLPGWRVLDKYAVAVGGGINHRAGLHDAILIKDNHVAAAGGVGAAVTRARASAPPHLWLQAEVESAEQAEEALAAGADALLLDNRSVEETRALVERFGDRIVLESSGGITLDNVRDYAETGVARISLGALTHSAPAVDVALEMI